MKSCYSPMTPVGRVPSSKLGSPPGQKSDRYGDHLQQTASAPSDWFTGRAYIDQIAPADPASRPRAYQVHFTPGARTGWHKHPNGQVIHVTEGVGLAQRRGGGVEQIRAGDTVHFDAGEDHWHGAAPGHFINAPGAPRGRRGRQRRLLGEKVSDEEYFAGSSRERAA